ncbi:MAG TPA: hypothetical protein DEB32_06025, partial [Stenotrophomonas sp.]|nr:hypothetical protein [Stenotrophomonas sp.]
MPARLPPMRRPAPQRPAPARSRRWRRPRSRLRRPPRRHRRPARRCCPASVRRSAADGLPSPRPAAAWAAA